MEAVVDQSEHIDFDQYLTKDRLHRLGTAGLHLAIPNRTIA
jgi:hypothetical protein